jgi:hypothetical protein
MPRRKSVFIKCSIPDCNGSMIARGWCRTHYYRWKNTGTTDLVESPPLGVRFWTRVNKDGPVHPVHGQCWVWTAGSFTGGYGAITVNGRLLKAHRVSWLLYHDDIPDDLCVLHKCDNPPCVNPAHLFLGTTQDNTADLVSKNRQARGERSGMAKLTAEIVRYIRDTYVPDSSTHGSTALARELDVSHQTILRVIKRKCWDHIP